MFGAFAPFDHAYAFALLAETESCTRSPEQISDGVALMEAMVGLGVTITYV